MEDYLVREYAVFEDEKYLKTTQELKSYFKDSGYDYFDCGQGYYQDESDITCKIGEKFYDVTMRAEIGSQKQDRGERFYFVENIESVTYKEIPKPKPKQKIALTYKLLINKEEKHALEVFLKNRNIDFKI